ncbi:MAG TPA: twin-arginine translocase TatA/TatE family subunit [Blastocatellia bacterium]|nr:twin-arginine translocase TatA/TatE family subunit [Blastocatellia bacterium]
MFGDLGLPELLVILVIALVLFGPKKLPELGSSFGKAIRGFRSGIKGDDGPETSVPGPERLEKQ